MAHHVHPSPVTSHSSDPSCLLAHCSFTSLPLPTSSAPPLDQRAALPSDPASRSCHGRSASSSACIIGGACSPHPLRMPALRFPGVVQFHCENPWRWPRRTFSCFFSSEASTSD
nr:uncharacterized protein LOC109745240 [Aegilops tauschii subsp. strangulata]